MADRLRLHPGWVRHGVWHAHGIRPRGSGILTQKSRQPQRRRGRQSQVPGCPDSLFPPLPSFAFLVHGAWVPLTLACRSDSAPSRQGCLAPPSCPASGWQPGPLCSDPPGEPCLVPRIQCHRGGMRPAMHWVEILNFWSPGFDCSMSGARRGMSQADRTLDHILVLRCKAGEPLPRRRRTPSDDG
jgi:hypothetical protein